MLIEGLHLAALLVEQDTAGSPDDEGYGEYFVKSQVHRLTKRNGSE